MSTLSGGELKKRRHNIKSLLRTIEPSIQAEIKKEVESKMGNSQTYDECLKGISDAFVFWRYIHEKPDFGFGLNNTLNVLPIFLDTIRTIAKRYNR